MRVSTPALLTMMSTRPNSLTAAANRSLQFGDPADIGLDADGAVAERQHLLLERFRRFGVTT